MDGYTIPMFGLITVAASAQIIGKDTVIVRQIVRECLKTECVGSETVHAHDCRSLLTPLDKMQFHISCSSHFIAYRIDRHSLLLAVCMGGVTTPCRAVESDIHSEEDYSTMDVREAVLEFQHSKLHLSRHSRRGYRLRLAVFTSWCEQQGLELEAITARHIRTFIDAVASRPGQKGSTLRPSSVRLYITTVKTFLSWCSKEEDFEELVSPKIVSRIPTPRIAPPLIETFTPEQIAALFVATEEQPFPVRDRAILSLLLDTGIRASELVGLTLDCCWLDPDDSYLLVHGKGKSREVPLGRTAR